MFGNIRLIGGLKEKLSYCEIRGIEHMFIPKDNENEYIQFKHTLSSSINIYPVANVKEVVEKIQYIKKFEE